MGKNVTLSARMQAVANMVNKGNRVCDVGCDHGYVSIYLVQQGIAPEVLAMDINKGPLKRARNHVEQAGLFNYITLRISDGLTAYHAGEAESLICAGMGGRLIQRILEKDSKKTESFQELILQPQSELMAFRKFLRNMGYSIKWEDMILEEGKFYPIIKAVPDKEKKEQADDELSDRFGPILLANKHPVLIKYLQKEWECKQDLREVLQVTKDSIKSRERVIDLEEEIVFLKEALMICGCKI